VQAPRPVASVSMHPAPSLLSCAPSLCAAAAKRRRGPAGPEGHDAARAGGAAGSGGAHVAGRGGRTRGCGGGGSRGGGGGRRGGRGQAGRRAAAPAGAAPGQARPGQLAEAGARPLHGALLPRVCPQRRAARMRCVRPSASVGMRACSFQTVQCLFNVQATAVSRAPQESKAAIVKHTSTAILRSDRHLSGSLRCARRRQVLHTEEATRAHAAALEALEEGEMLVDAPRPPRAAPGAPPQAAPPPPPPLPPPPPPPPAAAAAAAAFALPARATVLAPGARRVPWIFTQLGPWGAWGLSYEQRLCPCQRVPAARPGCPARAALDSGATWYHGLPMRRTCCAAAQGVGRDACRRAQRPGGQHSCSLTASRADRALGAAAGAPPMPSRGSGSAGKRTRSALPGNACLPPPAFLTVI